MKRAIVVGGIVVGGIVVLLVLVVGGFLLLSSLDSIVKAAIEKVGSDVTGTDVHVDEVDISLGSGEGAVRGFRVTNPDGFEDADAFQFDEVTMKIDLTTLTKDPVVIEEIIVQGPRIRYEFGGKGTNVGAIQKGVDSYSEGSEPSTGPNLLIRNLYFRNGSINFAGAKLLKEGVTTPLPDLHLTDIGSGEEGASPVEVAKSVMTALGRKVAGAASSVNLEGVSDALEEGAEEAKDAAKEAGKKLKDLLKND